MHLREIQNYAVNWIKVAQDWVRWRLAVTPTRKFCVLYRWRTFSIAGLIETVPTIIVIQTVSDSNAHTQYTLHIISGVHISIYSEIFTLTSGNSVKSLSQYS
jgi:hypothetical protein